MNACEAVQELLSASLLGALGESEQTLVTAHLAECERCRAVEEETRRCMELVAAPPVAPPAELWGKIQSKIDRTEAGTDPVRSIDPDVVISLSCSFCRGGMTRPTAVYCASCLAPHHPECFSEYGRCSVMGCGEVQIVRPAEAPPLPTPAPEPVAPAPTPKPARLRLLVGGLASVVLGGVAAAALIQYRADQDAAHKPSSEQGSAFDLGTKRYRIHVREATLDELIEEIEHQTRASISIPSPSRRARVGNILLRDRTWEGVHWLEVLSEIAKEHDLVVEQLPGVDRARIKHGAKYEPGPRVRTHIPVRQTLHVRAKRKPRVLYEGWDYRVLAAPQGKGVAIVRRDRIDVYWGRQPEGRTRQQETPPRGVTWSADGRRLAYAYNATVDGELEGRVGLFPLRVRPKERKNRYKTGLPPMRDDTSIAWLEQSHALAVTTQAGIIKVPIVGEGVIHMAAPRGAANGARLDLYSLGGNGLLVGRRDGLEAFGVAAEGNTAQPVFRSSTLPHGYQVDVTPGASNLLVRTPTLFFTLALPAGGSGIPPTRLGRDGLARLSRTGAFLATRGTDGASTYVRRIGGPTGHDRLVLMSAEVPPVAIHPNDFRWFGADGLLYWTDEQVSAVWFGVDDDGAPVIKERWGPVTIPDVKITDAQWAGDTPVVTVEAEKRREAITRVFLLDD